MRFRLDRAQKTGLVLFLSGGLAIFAGEEASLPAFTGIGAILLAVAAAIIGVQALATGTIRLPIDRRGEYEEAYAGIGARAWGLLFVLSSVALVIYGALKVAGLEAAGLRVFEHWPGLRSPPSV